jgi:hypothetical protein
VASLARLVAAGEPADSWKEWSGKLGPAGVKALRTFLQGIAAALGTGGAGSAVLGTGYWETVGVACIGAGITGVATFIQGVAGTLPNT